MNKIQTEFRPFWGSFEERFLVCLPVRHGKGLKSWTPVTGETDYKLHAQNGGANDIRDLV